MSQPWCAHKPGTVVRVSSDAGLLSASHWACVGSLSPAELAQLEAAKARARADLAVTAWMKQGWAYDGDALRPPGAGARGPGLPMEDAASLSTAAFRARYEQPNLPVAMRGAT